MTEIATTAVIERGAELGADVRIGPYAVIGPHVRIGSGTTVGPHAVIDGHTEIGQHCRVFPHAAVGLEPQDLKYRGELSWLRIGDRTVIREFATLNPGTAEGDVTQVGSDCLLMAYSHVAHNCRLSDHVILANAVNLAGHVTIGTHVVLGGVTPVHQFVRIGDHAIVGGGSRVPMDVAPYTLAAGNPLETHGLNVVGLARRGFAEEAIAVLKKVYRIFYRQNLGVDEAVARIRAEVPVTPEVTNFLEFVLTSERGLTR
jgi:UDP-N-acetylglucosamine acyltransferase